MLLTWLYIVCTLIRHVLLIRSGHTELLIPSGYAAILFASSVGPSVANATWRHCLSHFIDRVAARTCCAVDFFFFLLSWPWWTRSVVTHNMLKDMCIYIRKKIVNFYTVDSEFTEWCCSSGSFFLPKLPMLVWGPRWLCYKSKGHWFDPSVVIRIFRWHNSSNRTIAQKWVPGVFSGAKGGRCVRLTTLPPSCVVVM